MQRIYRLKQANVKSIPKRKEPHPNRFGKLAKVFYMTFLKISILGRERRFKYREQWRTDREGCSASERVVMLLLALATYKYLPYLVV